MALMKIPLSVYPLALAAILSLAPGGHCLCWLVSSLASPSPAKASSCCHQQAKESNPAPAKGNGDGECCCSKLSAFVDGTGPEMISAPAIDLVLPPIAILFAHPSSNEVQAVEKFTQPPPDPTLFLTNCALLI